MKIGRTRERLLEHYQEALEYFPEKNILGLFLQGSQNYKLDTPASDVDTKLIVVPTLREIAMNSKPVSTTHIRANEEHIDFKDVRLYIDTFRKQNMNFLEILFTDYFVVNPIYGKQWNRLLEHRELISRYNPFRAMKTMKGIAMEKYHAMEHPYPSKLPILEKYGYDGKQLHHLLRIKEFAERYLNGESYQNCLIPTNIEYLKAIKSNTYYSLDEARDIAKNTIDYVINLCDNNPFKDENNPEVEELFNDVRYEIIKTAIQEEVK